MNKKYEIGQTINWLHPNDHRKVKVKIVSKEQSDRGMIVNVEGEDFDDGILEGSLEPDGSGLK